MIVDQDHDTHPPHHCSTYSRHGAGTGSARPERHTLRTPSDDPAPACAHSRSDTGHPAQPEGLGNNLNRTGRTRAESWHLPREARGQLARSLEAYTGRVFFRLTITFWLSPHIESAVSRFRTAGSDFSGRGDGKAVPRPN